MSVYRQIHVSYWQDAFVLDLTPEEKYFYIYLMTNSKTSQIGIYELPLRVIEMETGYNRETVEKLLHRFKEYKKIDYNLDTMEIFLKNWPKHNWNNSPKVVTRVEKELSGIKHLPFINEYLTIVDSIKSDTVSIQYEYPMDTKRTNKEKEKKKDKEKDEPKEEVAKAPDARESQFEEWWNLYSNKKGRAKCLPRYKLKLKTYPHELIMAGTESYFKNRRLLGSMNEFVPNQMHPYTFLNGEHFNDEYVVNNGQASNTPMYAPIKIDMNAGEG